MFVFTSCSGIIISALTSLAASCACAACRCVSAEVVKTSARLAYSILFFLSMIVAWILRDYAQPLLEKIPWIIRGQIDPGARWFGQQAVYRVSFGSFLFFGGLSASLTGVQYRNDPRATFLQHGAWPLKALGWVLCILLPFFLPNSLITGYAYLARVGSVVFIFIQILLLIDFAHSWNDAWVRREDERYLYGLAILTSASYVGCLVFFGLLVHWYTPDENCGLNATLLTLSFSVCVAFTLVSLHPSIKNGSLFPSALLSFYSIYLLNTALSSEPHSYHCSRYHPSTLPTPATPPSHWPSHAPPPPPSSSSSSSAAASGQDGGDGSLVLGMMFTLVSIVYSAWRVGSNASLLTMESEEERGTLRPPPPPPAPSTSRQRATRMAAAAQAKAFGAELASDDVAGAQPLLAADALADATQPSSITSTTATTPPSALDDYLTPISYNYSFFHLIFALASMYLAMLMTGWSSGEGEARDLIDVGWASVWVKVVTQWVAGGLYIWTLIAPNLFPDRFAD